MTQQPLSRIERVDLRDVWKNEATNFTPWLAQHLAELGDALGLELEWQETEAPVGGYSLDILATDRNGDRPVVIENQLESTDHDHLGKLLTYAAGFNANVVVWLTREFREEHRQALDWLNQRTGEDTQFFGVVVELWKIDDSRPAPHFNLVAMPNGWYKNASVRRPVASRRRYRDFRLGLEERLRERGLPFRPGRDHSSPWKSMGGTGGLCYSADFGGSIMFSLQMDTMQGAPDSGWCRRAFDRLSEDKDDIEDRLGHLGELEWSREWGKRGSYIAAYYRQRFSDLPQDTWDEVYDWLAETYRQFRDVFEPYRDELLKLPASGC